MLRKRILYAILLLIPVAVLVTADYHYNAGVPGVWLFLPGCLVAWLAAMELHDMTRTLQLPASVVVTATMLVVVASGAPLAWPLMGQPYPPNCPVGRVGWALCAAALALVVLLIAEMVRYRSPGQSTTRIAAGMLIVTYIGVLYAFVVNLRLFRDNETGMTALVSLIFVVKMSDVGAYMFGKLFGRHKMASRLSPGKTVEGAVGGIATAGVCSVLWFSWLGPFFFPATEKLPAGPWWGWILYGLLLAVAGIVGDLSESLVKRDMQRKDSSSWLPGLGGVLDIIDSLLVAAPMAYACWLLGLVGPSA